MLVLLCAFSVGLVGVPVIHVAPKDRSIPFPCQDSVCGCRDAESCWRSCCCHTHAERAAWALERGIQPPAYVLEKAAREIATAKSCCVAHVARCDDGACSLDDGSRQDETTPAESVSDGREDASSVSLVFIDNYRKCRGLSPLWTVLDQALPARIETPSLPPLTAGEWLPCLSETISVWSSQPEPPPPRRATFFG